MTLARNLLDPAELVVTILSFKRIFVEYRSHFQTN